MYGGEAMMILLAAMPDAIRASTISVKSFWNNSTVNAASSKRRSFSPYMMLT
jgi:hypothetical protein